MIKNRGLGCFDPHCFKAVMQRVSTGSVDARGINIYVYMCVSNHSKQTTTALHGAKLMDVDIMLKWLTLLRVTSEIGRDVVM